MQRTERQLKQARRRLRMSKGESAVAARDIKDAAKEFTSAAKEIKQAVKEYKDAKEGAAAMAAANAARAELDKKPLGSDLNADKNPIRDEKQATDLTVKVAEDAKKEPESHLGAQLAGLAEAGVLGALAYNYVPWSSLPSATVAAAQATPGALATAGGAIADAGVATGQAIAAAAPVVGGALLDGAVTTGQVVADVGTTAGGLAVDGGVATWDGMKTVGNTTAALNNQLQPLDFVMAPLGG